jgi:small redox-active disulfide protein 2
VIKVKVLGSGCANCKTTQRLIEEVASINDIEIKLEKIEDMSQIISYGIMSTPGVIVNGEIVHAGGVPSKKIVLSWLLRS